MSDTPRTDEMKRGHVITEYFTSFDAYMEALALCGNLEYELTTVTRERDEWRACAEGLEENLRMNFDGCNNEQCTDVLARFRELKGESK